MRRRGKSRDKYKPLSKMFSGNRCREVPRSRPGLAWELLVVPASQWPPFSILCVCLVNAYVKLLFALFFPDFLFVSVFFNLLLTEERRFTQHLGSTLWLQIVQPLRFVSSCPKAFVWRR